MEQGITPVNATRLERVQGTANLPVDAEKLAALRAKLGLPPMTAKQAGAALVSDEVVISEMGKALYRFSTALARNPQMLAEFTASLPGALREELASMQAGLPAPRYDMALQLCMALYGPQVLARANTYGKNRKGRVTYLDYYRALFEHFGLTYDNDAEQQEDGGHSLLERFLKGFKETVAEVKDALKGEEEDGAPDARQGDAGAKQASGEPGPGSTPDAQPGAAGTKDAPEAAEAESAASGPEGTPADQGTPGGQ